MTQAAAREGIAYHGDQDGGDRGEGEQGREHGARHVEEAPQPPRRRRGVTHRPGRS